MSKPDKRSVNVAEIKKTYNGTVHMSTDVAAGWRIRILLGSDRSGFPVFQARRGCEFIVAGTLRVPSAKLGNTNSLGV